MLIDPKVVRLVIFNAGGGIVEREIKVSLQQGSNQFEIQNVPASFDPNSADILLEYLQPEDQQKFTLQQTTVSLPDTQTSNQIIDREKSAASNIISYSIDFTREMRERITRLCEASKYRTYSDMKGTFNFIINAKDEGEVKVKILYFIKDTRIRWNTTLQVNIDDSGKEAELEGFLIVNNQTGFSYDNVQLNFAIFQLPSKGFEHDHISNVVPPQESVAQAPNLRNEMLGELNRFQNVQPAKLKRTQRFKKLL
ncbi:MAG: hypothetical protein GF317_07395 [Candidatus Lokiarchaeota archaeon]|nr:hypothetical protein [Candidatus Lokiarchaeota archaeon]MBD3199533.1 hypothetical protein [Candidatus Lokiarchaeota archaeon]